MIKAPARALLTLLAGGGLCSIAHAQLPPGFDPSRIPSGVDLSRLPPGMTLPSGGGFPQLPSGMGTPQLPSGMNIPQIPSGMNVPQLPAGIDPSQIPSGFPSGGMPGVPGGYMPPAQGVAITSGGGAAAPPVVGGGDAPKPRNRPELNLGVDIQQTGEMQFSGIGDDVTFTQVTGNVDGRISNRRIVASGNYQLSYRIPEVGDIDKSVNHDGVMRVQANVIDEWLTMNTGVIVTRSRVDPGGAAPQLDTPNAKNLTQTYSTFIQPTLAHRFGDIDFAASYRYAYAKNEGQSTGVIGGPPTNRFDASTIHKGLLTLGMKRSELPFDWGATIDYQRENATNLAKHNRTLSATANVTVPAGHSLALVASGGYERTKISQIPALTDPITGAVVIDDNGRFIADPNAARQIVYDLSGIVADGGVVWTPSRRTRVELRAGYRYGDITITGEAEMKLGQRSALTVRIFDRIESFADSVSAGLAESPADLDLSNPLDPDSAFDNCIRGRDPGTGRCIGNALGQASSNSYREQSANLIFNYRFRRWSVSATAGYSRRKYIDIAGTVNSLSGIVDENFFGGLQIGSALSRESGISFSFRGNLFKNGQSGAADVKSGAFNAAYYRSFGRKIRLQANVSVDASKQDGMTADVSGRAQLGLQYEF